MNVIVERVDTPPRRPKAAEVVLVVTAGDDQIERIAELMAASTGRRCRIRRLPSEIAIVQTDLFTMRAKRACDPWLDASSTCNVYKVAAWLLEFWD